MKTTNTGPVLEIPSHTPGDWSVYASNATGGMVLNSRVRSAEEVAILVISALKTGAVEVEIKRW